MNRGIEILILTALVLLITFAIYYPIANKVADSMNNSAERFELAIDEARN